MNDNLFTGKNNPSFSAFEINRRAREQEKHFNSMEATWMAEVRESKTQKQGEIKVSLTSLQAFLSRINIKLFASTAHSHS